MITNGITGAIALHIARIPTQSGEDFRAITVADADGNRYYKGDIYESQCINQCDMMINQFSSYPRAHEDPNLYNRNAQSSAASNE